MHGICALQRRFQQSPPTWAVDTARKASIQTQNATCCSLSTQMTVKMRSRGTTRRIAQMCPWDKIECCKPIFWACSAAMAPGGWQTSLIVQPEQRGLQGQQHTRAVHDCPGHARPRSRGRRGASTGCRGWPRIAAGLRIPASGPQWLHAGDTWSEVRKGTHVRGVAGGSD